MARGGSLAGIGGIGYLSEEVTCWPIGLGALGMLHAALGPHVGAEAVAADFFSLGYVGNFVRFRAHGRVAGKGAY